MLVFPEGHARAGQPKPAGTKTCSDVCRSARARRIKRQKRDAGSTTLREGAHEASAITNGKVKDAAHEVLKEELRPVVREQMTKDVLSSIGDLINMTPRAIQLLEAQMESNDETISQRAVTLLLKYTLGNPSVAPPSQQAAPGGLTVQFNVPRPGDTTVAEVEPQQPSNADVELRECQDCHEHKPLSDFVAGSERCGKCFDDTRDLLRERFGDAYKG